MKLFRSLLLLVAGTFIGAGSVSYFDSGKVEQRINAIHVFQKEHSDISSACSNSLADLIKDFEKDLAITSPGNSLKNSDLIELTAWITDLIPSLIDNFLKESRNPNGQP